MLNPKFIVPVVHLLLGFSVMPSFAIRNPATTCRNGLSKDLGRLHLPVLHVNNPLDFDSVWFIRGGEIDLADDEDDASFVLIKLRNIIRGILSISDKKSKPLSALLRGCLKTIESLIGIKLLPSPTVKSSKKKKKTRKSTDTAKEDSSKEDSSTEETTDAPKETSKPTSSAATKKHLSTKIKSTSANYRIQRELKEFVKSPPPNLTVKVGSNIRVWIVTMEGAKNSIYEGEIFKLRVSFPTQYPTVPPSVYFLQGHIPIHEHVYTNGDICLSLLGKDWRPTMTAQSIAVSILSILSSAQSKSLPMDNARHAGNKPGEYQKDWVYHDDNC